MKLSNLHFGLLLLALPVQAVDTNALPAFDELYPLVRSNAAGVSAQDLDRAAVRGLLRELRTQVVLGEPATNSPSTNSTLARSTIYDNGFTCFQIGRIEEGLATKIAAAQDQLAISNKAPIKGMVLDLRFAGGTNYAAAAAVTDLFLNTEEPLLDWGAGSARSTAKTNALSLPMAVLVNTETTGAAEALAALLRDRAGALLVGNPTAGTSGIFKEFVLANGNKVHIMATLIKINGTQELIGSVTPDIAVRANLEDERAFLAKALKPVPAAQTNLADNADTNQPRRINEAELVRLQKKDNGDWDDTPKRARRDETPRTIIPDPALARAIELLKAISVLPSGHKG